MTIWVDADACPNVIKEILYRAAERMQMPLVLVANQSLRFMVPLPVCVRIYPSNLFITLCSAPLYEIP